MSYDSSMFETKIFPSPFSPVWAVAIIAETTDSTIESWTTVTITSVELNSILWPPISGLSPAPWPNDWINVTPPTPTLEIAFTTF